MQVYVVTGLSLGWDNLVGVFHNVSLSDLSKRYPSDEYVISETTVETVVDED